MAHMRGHAPSDLQRRDGNQQKRRPRGARLADHLRLQYVFVSGFEMGGRNFVRTHASIDGFAGRIAYYHPLRVALAARRPTLGPNPRLDRGCWRNLTRNSRRSPRYDDERSNRHLSRLRRTGVSSAACFHRTSDDKILAVDYKSAFRFTKVLAN